ncbi:large conductance mechanosensitive channel protein MscL [Microbacterium lushaniae]|uniref:Large-conductance mechanosensitive channel n=1 Tax=Microbacterium lushaniae TaxID=2614639 RepID=A0A5J5JBN4_9MICO|nr:large conductance mechanosensitive channel protein MscL [Microbacterium lushaniae]KAA9144967.1 large conductance mechanosensitive channel protein MscL [Microbacterium lushaniae]KAA9157367.1 large conductance mechanosensitive channel protein MscL [Microbacterium lushaniae]QEW03749.1 large conductance mechanosensitive channel protein MscL [Microbacterium lushaniae]
MIKGFKEFILRGNVIDLAVAVVIGAAFTAIVNALVDNLINPLIALIFQADSLGDVGFFVTGLTGNEVFFGWGAIVGALINFLGVAAVVYFVFVYPMNRVKERAAARAGASGPDDEPQLPTEQELLVQIRDLLEKSGPAARA